MFGPAHRMHWTPLFTQQLRLRHLTRIIGYNVTLDPSIGKGLYYTLHLATMCSPFYTSDTLKSDNPKWKDLEINDTFGHNSGVVVRIWQQHECKPDKIISVWGVYFSGLIYLGNKYAELQSIYFEENALIFQFIGGFFTCQHCIKKNPSKPIPFKNQINVQPVDNIDKIYRNLLLHYPKNEVRSSYSVDKLQRLHSLQLAIRKKKADTDRLREQIYEKCPIFDGTANSHISKEKFKEPKPNISSLNMSVTSLNKYLNQQNQPSRFERQKVWRLKKLIETAKFNCKLLAHERDRKTAYLRQLTLICTKIGDENEDQNSLLMDKYRQLSRDFEKLREWRKTYVDTREACLHASVYLNLRRKELLAELLDIYPILKVSDEIITICGVHLPDSESLGYGEDTAISVALGYVTHVMQMCSIFLNIPLRYPVIHNGSRSKIYDHITDKIPEKEREFPLYARRKDELQFNYAIYLLNKNIAQLRWFCGLPTQDLRATLENLYTLLQFRNEPGGRPVEAVIRSQSSSSADVRSLNTSYPLNKQKVKRSNKPETNLKEEKHLSGSRDILNKNTENITTKTPRSLLGVQLAKANISEHTNSACDTKHLDQLPVSLHCVDCNIEQGLDLLDPRANVILCSTFNEHSIDIHDGIQQLNKPRITRSVGSYTDEVPPQSDMSPSSEPVLGKQSLGQGDGDELTDSFQEERTEFLQEWLNSGPALVCSEENLYPEEILGTTITCACTDDSGKYFK